MSELLDREILEEPVTMFSHMLLVVEAVQAKLVEMEHKFLAEMEQVEKVATE
jgi:hypothetical protein